MSTMYDVAHRAGVSVATVSRYFNGGYVSSSSRKAIDEAITFLGYKPNRIARTLSIKSSRVIGLVVPSVTNPFFPELARAVEGEASRKDYQVLLCNAEDSVEKEKRFIDALTSSFAEGIISSTGNCGPYYEENGIPVVSVDRELSTGAPHVTSDNYSGGRMACDHLAEKGCSRLVFIGASSESTSQKHRREGFFDEALKIGLPTPHLLIADDTDEYQALLEEGKQLSAYEGIFAWNDYAAIQAIRALHQAGYSVPEDARIVGFDDIHIARLYTPSLTTIAQPIYEMGRAATELLLRQIEGEKLDGVKYLLSVSLVERETSTAPIRTFSHNPHVLIKEERR
ncbi:MAG: LacI family DNA-binding transcriptional regulator [Spirochaetales bacterium]|nr:LacI family DNA-binding transcriptional regulator [Spirochaetales bacterium]